MTGPKLPDKCSCKGARVCVSYNGSYITVGKAGQLLVTPTVKSRERIHARMLVAHSGSTLRVQGTNPDRHAAHMGRSSLFI